MIQRFDINLVAHADDDTLFMQPDIYDSYVAGRGQVGVAVTAANNIYWNDMAYTRRLETAGMDAYAQMGLLKAGRAGAQSGMVRWRIGTAVHAGFTVTTADCIDYPDLRWIFLRLPGAPYMAFEPDAPDGKWHKNFAGQLSETGFPRLQDLWQDAVTTLTPVDAQDGQAYSKEQLIDVLAAILGAYQPFVVRTEDFRFANGPSNISSSLCYDHPDHYFTGLFSQRAIQQYARSGEKDSQFWVYNGYNIANLDPNVYPNLSEPDRNNKAWMFYYFSINNPDFNGFFDRTLLIDKDRQWQGNIYAQWLWRQVHKQFDPWEQFPPCQNGQ